MHYIGDCEPQSRPRSWGEKVSWVCWESNPHSSIVKPVASSSSSWATLQLLRGKTKSGRCHLRSREVRVSDRIRNSTPATSSVRCGDWILRSGVSSPLGMMAQGANWWTGLKPLFSLIYWWSLAHLNLVTVVNGIYLHRKDPFPFLKPWIGRKA
jgi:hypothetical protein